jgi:hypothetical protein
MLPEGVEECPRCGARLSKAEPGDEGELGRSQVFWFSAYTIGIVLIPIVIGVVIGLLCILLFLANQR